MITTRTTLAVYQTSKTIVPQTTTTLPKLSLTPSLSSFWETTALNAYSPSSEKVSTISNLQSTHIGSKTTDDIAPSFEFIPESHKSHNIGPS